MANEVKHLQMTDGTICDLIIPKKYKILLNLGSRTITATDLATNTVITNLTEIVQIIKTYPIDWQVTGLASGHVGRIYDARIERGGYPEGNELVFQIVATNQYPGTSGTKIPLYIHYTQVYYFDEAQANWVIDDYYYPVQGS